MRFRTAAITLLGALVLPRVSFAGPRGGSDPQVLRQYYLSLKRGVSWYEARKAAQALGEGWDLATITSPEERDYIDAAVITAKNPPGEYWIGGYQNPIDTPTPSAQWMWVTGEPWSYAPWRPGEPDDRLGMASEQWLTYTRSRDGRFGDSHDKEYNSRPVRLDNIVGWIAKRTRPESSGAGQSPTAPNLRVPRNEAERRFWLTDMVVYHHYSKEEIGLATGYSDAQIDRYLSDYGLAFGSKPASSPKDRLVVMPYPGGRHPRVGTQENALSPLRETKFSVFLPWDPESYVVVDLPEAIIVKDEVVFLAHEDPSFRSIWTSFVRDSLPQLEWVVRPDGSLVTERTLPNGIFYAAEARPGGNVVWMDLYLKNGGKRRLSTPDVKVCNMLKTAHGFNGTSNDNKVFAAPYAACATRDRSRWIITGWTNCFRVWGNAQVPCIHSDPQLPDCEPGQTLHLRGFVSFFEGTDIEGELSRLDRTGWMRVDSTPAR